MRTRLATLLCVAAMLAMALGPAVALAAGDTWLVNGAYDDNGQCISAVRHCKTIQAAVTAAAEDDTILIAAGIYDEAVVISGKRLTLSGAGDTTVIKPSSANLTSRYAYPAGIPFWPGVWSAPVILVKDVPGAGVTIQNLKVDGAGIGSLPTLPTVPDRIAGIQYGESNGKIKNVTVDSIKTAGYLHRGTGIDLSSVAAGTVEVADSRISNSARNGILAIGGNITVNIHGNTVVGPPSATAPAQLPNGIFLMYGVTGAVVGNRVEKFHYFDDPDWTSIGITLYGSNAGSGPVTIEANEVLDCDNGIGVSGWEPPTLGANNAVVKNNYIHGNGVGLLFEGSATNNQAFGNTITGNGKGLVINGPLAKDLPGLGNSAHSNNISGNTTNAVTYDTTKTFDATGNWWGSASGPGVIAYLNTTPFAKALASSTTASTHEVGETGILTTSLNVNGLYGAQLRVTHDPLILNWSSGIAIPVISGSWYWDVVTEPFTPTTAPVGRRLSGANQGKDTHPAANLAGAAIARWNYTCAAPGTSVLAYDTTAGKLGTKLSDINGLEIPAALTGDSITCLAATGSVTGTIGLQGRLQGAPLPTGWNGAVVVLTCTTLDCSGYGPYVLTSGANGSYQLVKSGPGTGIALGTYSASVSRRAYLGASKGSPVVISAPTTTISPVPTLLGGDVDDSGAIDVTDLSTIGTAFGLVPAGGQDTGADINGDNIVNIFDLVLCGGNYGLSVQSW